MPARVRRSRHSLIPRRGTPKGDDCRSGEVASITPNSALAGERRPVEFEPAEIPTNAPLAGRADRPGHARCHPGTVTAGVGAERPSVVVPGAPGAGKHPVHVPGSRAKPQIGPHGIRPASLSCVLSVTFGTPGSTASSSEQPHTA